MTAASPPPLPDVPVIVAAPSNTFAVREMLAHPMNFSPAQRLHTQMIVLHCTDGCEGTAAAESCATMFRDPKLSPHRSAHYAVDADSATRCVPDMLTAWHCGHTGNAYGIGVELCGRADQTRNEWLDSTSMATLSVAARLVATLCTTHGIPAQVVNDRGLLAGVRGITTHSFVSSAWKQSDHHDPGAGFPLGAFVMAVSKALLFTNA